MPKLSFLTQLLLGLCVLLASTAWAVDNQPLTQQSLQHSQTGETSTLFNRQQWDLSEKEWQRYQQLMQGIRGSISPKTLSPIEVLGTHAKTDAERKKYAKRWAKMMYEDISNILAFQLAYDEAWRELYPNEQIIDLSKLDLKPNQINPFQTGDRILAFVRIKACDLCKALIKRIQKQTQSMQVQLDIYFLDTEEPKDNNLIHKWAKELDLDQKRIKQRKITLNHDKGTLFSITQQIAAPNKPLLYRIRNLSIQAVAL